MQARASRSGRAGESRQCAVILVGEVNNILNNDSGEGSAVSWPEVRRLNFSLYPSASHRAAPD